MAAETTVPAVLGNLHTQLDARPGLTTPTKVAVHVYDRQTWSEPEAIVFGKVTGPAEWIGLGTLVTKEDATLDGYIFVGIGGDTDADAKAAQARAGALLNELVQQTRDDPSVGGALTGAKARIPPRVSRATWTTWDASTEGTAIFRVRIDFQLTWQARTG